MASIDFTPEFDFQIDDGQLDGLTPQQCFVMGCELKQILLIAETVDNPIGRPVRALNADRIRRACEHYGREYKLEWMRDDKAEYWMWLEIAPRG